METIDIDVIERAKKKAKLEEEKKKAKQQQITPILLEDDTSIAKELIESFDKPIERQKEMAAKIKIYLDSRMRTDLEETQTIKESTRRFIELYNDLIDKLHKNLYGEKSVNLHLHKVSHDHIRQFIQQNIKKDATVEVK